MYPIGEEAISSRASSALALFFRFRLPLLHCFCLFGVFIARGLGRGARTAFGFMLDEEFLL